MLIHRPFWFILALLGASSTGFAGSARVEFSRAQSGERPTDVVAVSWAALVKVLPDAKPEKLKVTTADGRSLGYQFTNLHPDDRQGRYDEILFPYTFRADEKSAHVRIETTDTAPAPFPTAVFARHVPERYDDFAWENNRIAHRIYGAGLATEVAGRSRMISSGVDVWCKRVGYPVIDRWYLRGHDAYHKDNGEGLDFYSVGTGRGAGGTGVWVGGRLHPSGNWATVRVIANGPVRALFEVSYAEWQPTPSLWVRETRRYTVDVDRNLDRVEATFVVTGAEETTVAVGLGKHAPARGTLTEALASGYLSLWEAYPKPDEGELGTAIAFPNSAAIKYGEDELNHLALIPVRSGRPFVYFAGAGWSRSGQFADAAAWEAHVKAILAAEADPLRVSVTPLQP